jgi:hypothetical protein
VDDPPNSNNHETTLQHQLWRLLHEVPRSQVTPKTQTDEILSQIRKLESVCPTEPSQVLQKISGNWELLWTTQDNQKEGDDSNDDSNNIKNEGTSWIRNLENQSYSNNALGRSNPILPRAIQDRLESYGFLDRRTSFSPVSTQSIDLKKQVAINAVSFSSPSSNLKGFLAIRIALSPHGLDDPRRVNVLFQNCRVSVPSLNGLDFTIPLWPLRLSGWLRTTYVDDEFRISRGHKGSVFVLARPKAQKKNRCRTKE